MSSAEARLRLGAAALLLGSLQFGAGQRPGRAQDAELPTLRLVLPAELHVGEHARAVLSARLPAGTAKPLLVTPFREGGALEIVKGRLLRSDALEPGANPLRFELPVVALSPGAAVIGARLLAYVCTDSCRAVEVETRTSVIVLPR